MKKMKIKDRHTFVYQSKRAMATSDPFVSDTGTINPLSVGTSVDEYSVKITTRQPRTTVDQINVYAGTFTGDLTARAVGIQAAILAAMETAIQDLFADDFDFGALPSLGKPTSYTFLADDLLVSFAARNDYFIFNGTGATREVRFISLGQPDGIYQPGAMGAPATFTFVSATSEVSYEVSYPATGDFTITDNRGRVADFDNTAFPTVTATYESVALTEVIHGDNTATYTTTPYTEIGITQLPNPLPVDPNDIIVAEGVSGFFYQEGTSLTAQTLIDYIIAQYPTFTTTQQACIGKICRYFFNISKNAVKQVINDPNLDAFSTGTGFAGYAALGNISLEIRIT